MKRFTVEHIAVRVDDRERELVRTFTERVLDSGDMLLEGRLSVLGPVSWRADQNAARDRFGAFRQGFEE